MATITLRDDQHVGAIGRTGCGKTTLMRALLEPIPNVVVVDSKWRVDFPGYYLTTKAMAAFSEKKVIYRPSGKIPDTFWKEALETLHERGGGVLYVDEMPEVSSANYIPPGLATIFRLGRELGVSVWWSGQEAVGVANTAIRQSQVLLLFLNHGASDRDKLIRTAGDIGEVTAYLNLYEFVVYESGGDAYNPISIPVYTLGSDGSANA